MKIERGPFAGMNVRWASARREYGLRDEVQRIVRWLGISGGAICTDGSSVGDFEPPRWRMWMIALRARMRITHATLLVDIAERIKRP